MRPWQPWSIRFLVLPLAVAAGLWGSAPAAAGCSWKFNWSCPSCGKIGGATSGAQGGYPSKSACEAARRGANSAVSTSSCVQVGTCDGTVTRQPPPDDDYLRRQEEEARRQEEARAKEAAERKAREQAAFEKSKGELLGQLKGVLLYSPIDMNKALAKGFHDNGWTERRTSYWVTSDDKLIRRTMQLSPDEQKSKIEAAGLVPIRSYNQTDFVKERCAVEAQFGKYPFVAYDLFVKHMAFFVGDVIDVGIEILPMKDL